MGVNVDEFFRALAKVSAYTWVSHLLEHSLAAHLLTQAFSQVTKGVRGFAAIALANPMNGVIQRVSRHFNLSYKTVTSLTACVIPIN